MYCHFYIGVRPRGEAPAVMEAHLYGRVERKKDATSAAAKNSPKQDYVESYVPQGPRNFED